MLAASGLSCSMWDLPCGMQNLSLWCVGSLLRRSGFSLLLWHMGSVVVVHGLSCPVACGILVPGSGIKPVSPALEGRFLITGPPVKSQEIGLLGNLFF